MRTSLAFAVLLILVSVQAVSARKISDRELARQRAEHLCYDDVQRLCSDAVPDEAKIQACMRAKRAELSPPCRRAFDAGSR